MIMADIHGDCSKNVSGYTRGINLHSCVICHSVAEWSSSTCIYRLDIVADEIWLEYATLLRCRIRVERHKFRSFLRGNHLGQLCCIPMGPQILHLIAVADR